MAEPLHAPDVLRSTQAGGKVVRGSLWRILANLSGALLGLGIAVLLLRHLGVRAAGRYVTVMSLVAIPVYVADLGLNVTASRELALTPQPLRRPLLANVLGQRLLVMPGAVLLLLAFSGAVGYPAAMVAGVALAGTGAALASLANVLLLPYTVALQNLPLALLEVVRQGVGLLGTALLVGLGATLTPFFAVQLVVGVAALLFVAALAGRTLLLGPRFDRAAQRRLLQSGLPLALALALGQAYFRIVIVIMSLVSSPSQTGYFGGSLRAMENVVLLPILVAGVAVPLLAAAGREDRPRMVRMVRGLSEGAALGGVLVILATVPAAPTVMALVGGGSFRPAGGVLRIQVCSLLLIFLYQLFSAALLALGRQRELVLTNGLALLAVAALAAALVPPYGAEGGAAASVLGDALLCALIYWRLRRAVGPLGLRRPFLGRLLLAAAGGALPLPFGVLPGLGRAALAAFLFVAVGFAVGAVPDELKEALAFRRNQSANSH